MTLATPRSNPGVRFPPPLIFIIGLLIGWVLDQYVVALPLTRAAHGGITAIGAGLMAVGVLLAAWGIITFRRAHTTIIPNQSASHLVIAGPYRFTRNPMYTGMTITYVGAAALLRTAWPLVLLPLVLVVLVRFVIRREERYLYDAFGAEYADFCGRVRRWL